MVASLFDLFKIGIGPSSSHTMGPMTAGARFVESLAGDGLLSRVARVETRLFGSLALTGKGHATDRAVLLGLTGRHPNGIDPDEADRVIADIRGEGHLPLGGTHMIRFHEPADLLFLHKEKLPFHPNAMTFTAFDDAAAVLLEQTFYSIGGGAVLRDDETGGNMDSGGIWDAPFAFTSGAQLLEMANAQGGSIADIMRANELVTRDADALSAGIAEIAEAMNGCIDRGIKQEGILPGGLQVRRRAPLVYAHLMQRQERMLSDPLTVIDWVNLWALAVNEENAAGGRVVTAPTNGAAGIIPAVLRFYQRFAPRADAEGVETFLLTAAAVGSLFKENASISGAEVGCQGEVGVACSMAAGGLAAAWGGTPEQVENAAEIGMEHNLGLTCDPVAGLVQVPCIERNAIGAVKAIEAARLAMMGDGTHRVSLDDVIVTMRKTGLDMNERYKETSQGGLAVNLAVNIVEC